MRLKLYLATFILMFIVLGSRGLLAQAQSSVEVEARVNRNQISRDEQLLLTVTVSGDFTDLPNPDLSGLSDFSLISSSTSRQVSIINGRTSAEATFNYVLQPLESGRLIIPAISVNFGGQVYRTKPIEVSVSDGTAPPPINNQPPTSSDFSNGLIDQNLFVEAEVDNTNPYLGQQILYTFRFYQATDFPINFSGRLDYQAPSFTDFWSQTLSQPSYPTRIGDRTYTVTEVRTALFPAGLNDITIEPARLVVPGGLFNPDVVLETKPITVRVQSLPPGAPPNFNGAVGQFELRAIVDTAETRVNDTVNLTLEIEGAGNIDALTEPTLPELTNWRRFDSQTSTALNNREDQVFGVRRFERILVPGQPGEQLIPPVSFSYYDPEQESFQTVSTDPLLINVLPGEGEFEEVSEPVDLVTGELGELKAVPSSLGRSRFFSLTNPLYWLCWLPPLLIVATIWVIQTQRQRLLTDTGYARRLRAKRVAHRVLQETSAAGHDRHSGAQRALLGYLSDKLNRPTAGLTTQNLIKILIEENLSPDLIERVRVILNQIETSRFAPIGEMATRSLLAETRTLIDDLEKAFGR